MDSSCKILWSRIVNDHRRYEEYTLSNIIVIGGGAAGMMAAVLLGEKGHQVTLMEHNEKLGKKIFITGKGRCNFTNACTEEEFLENVPTNSKFLFSAIHTMNSQAVIDRFESWGMKTKVERGRRAFPESDHAFDVIDALRRQLRKYHVEVMLETDVKEILYEEQKSEAPTLEELLKRIDPNDKYAVKKAKKEAKKNSGISRRAVGVRYCEYQGETKEMSADYIILATGGLSYPSTGSTGDGYRFAKEAGLKVTSLYPSLVPLACKEEYLKEMQGLSLKNVELHIKEGKKELYSEFGEMMFTHFGITGPLVLSASAILGPKIGNKELTSWIDLKPAVSEEQLDHRFLELFKTHHAKELKNILPELYPGKMVPIIPEVAGVDSTKKAYEISREERLRLVEVTKHFPLTLESLRGYNEAVITKGGISVKEIDPKTMQVKNIPGLYCIGEVLDVDAFTGGYNLQIAWATAAVCAGAI